MKKTIIVMNCPNSFTNVIKENSGESECVWNVDSLRAADSIINDSVYATVGEENLSSSSTTHPKEYFEMLNGVKEAIDNYHKTEYGVSLTTSCFMEDVTSFLEEAQEDGEFVRSGYESCTLIVHVHNQNDVDDFIKEAEKELYEQGVDDVSLVTLLVSTGNEHSEGKYDFVYQCSGNLKEDIENFRENFFPEVMEATDEALAAEDKGRDMCDM